MKVSKMETGNTIESKGQPIAEHFNQPNNPQTALSPTAMLSHMIVRLRGRLAINVMVKTAHQD